MTKSSYVSMSTSFAPFDRSSSFISSSPSFAVVVMLYFFARKLPEMAFCENELLNTLRK